MNVGSARTIRLGTVLAATIALQLLVATAPLPVAAVSWGTCQNSLEEHYFTYTEKAPVTQNVRNVRADIKGLSVTDQFRPCRWDPGFDGSSGWVAIAKSGSTQAILQIGVIACNGYPQSACQSGQKRYFWAEGVAAFPCRTPRTLAVRSGIQRTCTKSATSLATRIA